MRFHELPFWERTILIPLIITIIGILLGWFTSRKLRLTVENGKFAENSFLWILFGSLGKLPMMWGGLLGVNISIQFAAISEVVKAQIANFLFTLFIWTAAVYLQRTISQTIVAKSSNDGNPASTSLLLNLANATVYLVGIIIVLDEYNVSITPIITALGVGGMAIALGLQETMANIFAGLHILLTKQIRIGDHIRLEGGAEGKIIDITWRYAKIHTVTNNIIIVPNNKLAAAIVTNFDMSSERDHSMSVMDVAFKVAIGVSYNSNLDEVERITLEVAREVLKEFDPELDTTNGASTAPNVRYHSFGESSIDFDVNLHTTSFKNQYLIRHEFIKALKRRYDEEKIEIPFPIRQIKMDR